MSGWQVDALVFHPYSWCKDNRAGIMQLSPPKLIAPEQQFAACLTDGGGFVPLEPFY